MILACVVLFIVLILIGVMIYDGNHFVVEKYELYDSRVNKDTSFVFLTDLHNKEYGKNNDKLYDAIKKLNPDAILIGGDFIIGNARVDTSRMASFVGRIKDIAPVFYALGNHEYRTKVFSDEYGDMFEKYLSQLNQYGIEFLDNEYCDYENFRIWGLSIGAEYYKKLKSVPMDNDYIGTLIDKPSEEKINVLLAHNPDYFEQYSYYGADLTLSGHLHGGIVRIPFFGGILSPRISFFPKYNGGLYNIEESKMIVSRGLGMHTIPIRLFNIPEISYITYKAR